MSTERYIPESAVRDLIDAHRDGLSSVVTMVPATALENLLATAAPQDEIERLRLRGTRLYELLNRCEMDVQRALRVSDGECSPLEEYVALRGACEAIQQRAAGVKAPQDEAPEPEGLREAAIALQESLSALIQQSEGVAGLHLNGDLAPWEELMAGGRYEEWLRAYDDFGLAIAAAAPQPKPPTGGGWRCTECGIIYPDEMDPSEGEDCSCGAEWDESIERITFDARPAAAEGVEGKRHRWSRDGERCLDCGDKDWMAGPVCNAPATDDEEETST